MRPTVGMIIHYYDAKGERPIAAIITAIPESADEGRVHLMTFAPPGHSGHCVGRSHVLRSDKPKPCHWCWPPQVEGREAAFKALGQQMVKEGLDLMGPISPQEPRSVPPQPITGPQCGPVKGEEKP